MGGKEYSTFLGGPTLAVPPVPVPLAHASCLGGWAIESNTTAGDYREWYYRAYGNAPRGTRNLSMRVRFAPNYSGTPPNDIHIMNIGQPRSSNNYGGARITLQDNNTCLFFSQPKNGFGNLILSAPSMAAIPLASGVFRDYMLVMNDAAGTWAASIEGVEVASGSLAGDGAGTWDLDSLVSPSIIFGTWPFRGWINEATIWDSVEPHVYSPRSAWLDCADFDGTRYDNVAANELKSGISRYQAGVQISGSVVAAAKATTKLGVQANDGVGEYVASELYTDVPESKVERDYEYAYASATPNRTGERDTVENTMRAGVMRGGNKGGVMRGGDQ